MENRGRPLTANLIALTKNDGDHSAISVALINATHTDLSVFHVLAILASIQVNTL